MKKVLGLCLAGILLLGISVAQAEDVFVTKNGKKYHKQDCLLIQNKGGKAVSMEEVEAKSLKPCRRCFGEQTDNTIVVNTEPGLNISK